MRIRFGISYCLLGTVPHIFLGLLLQDRFVGLGRAIVISAEPIIQRHIGFPVVALKMTVMQMMETVIDGNPEVPLENQLLEPGMPLSRRERIVLGIHQHMDGMRGQDPVNQHTAENNQVLNGMHGHTGPGPDIDVFVMEVVHPLEERRPVFSSTLLTRARQSSSWLMPA